MTLTELAKRIDLPEEALEAAQMVEFSDAEYQTCKELFDRDLGAFLKEWKEKEEPGRYIWALRFYLRNGFYDIGTHSFFVGEDEQTDRIMRKDIAEK